jgi:hypothetical protein
MKNMKNMKINFGLLALWLLGFCGCIKDSNPPVPAYIFVESLDFVHRSYAADGTASQRITDAWISVNGQLIGANNLPALLPVILNDTTEDYTVVVRAGIENDGIVNRKFDYPFFTRHTEVRRLQAGKIDTIRASVSYDNTANIRNVEDFEGVGVIFGDDRDGNSNTNIVKSQEDVFEGDFSGKFVLDSANIVCTAATSVFYANIQPAGSAFPVYMEMNYKTELPISVGLVARYSNGATETVIVGGMNPKDTWNKIYFNFTSTVFTQNAVSYAIVFDVVNSEQKPNPKVYIDNVKLLHY